MNHLGTGQQTLSYSSGHTREEVRHWLGVLSIVIGVGAGVMLLSGLLAERHFLHSIPAGKDEDDVGGVPSYIVALIFLPFIGAAVGFALGVAARFMGDRRLGWTGMLANIAAIGVPIGLLVLGHVLSQWVPSRVL
ncbi:MAG TPA: hypothetical protein VF669_06990 [Tepidisphaeraceae bacterium]|jgi:hypothetical protein